MKIIFFSSTANFAIYSTLLLRLFFLNCILKMASVYINSFLQTLLEVVVHVSP